MDCQQRGRKRQKQRKHPALLKAYFSREESARGLCSGVWACLYLRKCTSWNSINRGASVPLSVPNIFFSSDVCLQHFSPQRALNKCMLTYVRLCSGAQSIPGKSRETPKMKNHHSVVLQKPETESMSHFTIFFLSCFACSKGTNKGRCLSQI